MTRNLTQKMLFTISLIITMGITVLKADAPCIENNGAVNITYYPSTDELIIEIDWIWDDPNNKTIGVACFVDWDNTSGNNTPPGSDNNTTTDLDQWITNGGSYLDFLGQIAGIHSNIKGFTGTGNPVVYVDQTDGGIASVASNYKDSGVNYPDNTPRVIFPYELADNLGTSGSFTVRYTNIHSEPAKVRIMLYDIHLDNDNKIKDDEGKHSPVTVINDTNYNERNEDNSEEDSYCTPAVVICKSVDNSLPVEVGFFNASKSQETVVLEWNTESELNNLGFEIERSTNTQNWEVIGFERGVGTSLESQFYSFVDERPLPGNNYYRLKQMDFDGSFEYSDIRSVFNEVDAEHFLQVFPNPNEGVFTMSLRNPGMKKAFIKLFDSTGNLIWQQDFKNEEIQSYWEKEFDLPQYEVYFLMTQIGDIVETRKVVVVDKK